MVWAMNLSFMPSNLFRSEIWASRYGMEAWISSGVNAY